MKWLRNSLRKLRRKKSQQQQELKATQNVIDRRKRQIATKRAQQKGSLALRAWHEAKKLLGVMEVGGNNSGPVVSAIIKANGGGGPEPWCGDFVAFCYRHAGSKVVQRGWAAVRLLGFLTGMTVTSEPVMGDIVVYTFDHTGLFGYWCNSSGHRVPRAQATHIRTREGNTGRSGAVSDSRTGGDGVYEKIRPRSYIRRFVHVTR